MPESAILRDSIKRDCVHIGNPTQTGTEFCLWILKNVYDLTADEADAALCGGSHDGGIDAFFERYGTLTILQTKYSDNDHLSKIAKLVLDVDHLLTKKLTPQELVRLKPLLETLNDLEASESPYSVRLVYATADSFAPNIGQKLQTLHDKHENLNTFDLERIADALQDKIANISPRWRDHIVTLSTKASFYQDGIWIASVPLAEIARLAREAGDYLFASNVRNYLRATKVNKGMKKTLIDNPKDFWVFNNGITITCSEVSSKSSELSLKAPQVVNGCQTVSTIRDVAATLKDPSSFASCSVLVRIIDAVKEDRRAEITRYTNAQNSVRGKDLYSLERYQKDIRKTLKQAGYIYEIQRGEAAQMKPQQRLSYKPSQALRYLEPKKWNRQIAAIEAVQAIAATRKLKPEIAYASSQDLTPLGEYYDELFPADAMMDHRFFYLPYLVVLYAKSHLSYGRGGSTIWRKTSHYLFSSAFHILVGLECGIEIQQGTETSSADVTAAHYEAILTNEDRAVQMLKMADNALEGFFDDGKIEEIIETQFNGDLKNLLKRTLVGSAWWPIFVKRIRREHAK